MLRIGEAIKAEWYVGDFCRHVLELLAGKQSLLQYKLKLQGQELQSHCRSCQHSSPSSMQFSGLQLAIK